MAKGFTPIIGLAVVVALALAAVFGAISLTNPAFAAVGAPADAELAERGFSPQDATLTFYDGQEFEHDITSSVTGGGSNFGMLVTAETIIEPAELVDGTVAVDAGFGAIALQLTGGTLDDDADPLTGRIYITLALDEGDDQRLRFDVTLMPETDPSAVDTIDDLKVQAGVDDDPSTPNVDDDALPGKKVDVDVSDAFMDGIGTGGEIAQYRLTAAPLGGGDAHVEIGEDGADAQTDGDWAVTQNSDDGKFELRATDTAVAGDTSRITVQVRGDDDDDGTANTDADATLTFFVDVVGRRMVSDGVGSEGLPSFESDSTTPGSVARYELEFDIGELTNTLINDLIIELKDYGVPSSISTSSVTIETGPYTFTPEDVSVDDEEIFISIGDVTEDSASNRAANEAGGVYEVGGATETMKVVFRKSAGISNPTEQGTYFANITFGENKWEYDEDAETPKGLEVVKPVVRKISLSEEDGGLGDVITATGKGYKNGTSLTVFLDKKVLVTWDDPSTPSDAMVPLPADMVEEYDMRVAMDEDYGNVAGGTIPVDEDDETMAMFVDDDGYAWAPDGELDGGDDVLCVVDKIGGNDVGKCDFTVAHPAFAGGLNYVDAVDGRNGYATEPDTFELTASIEASPAGGSPGEIILIQVVDFTSGASIDTIRLGRQFYCGEPNPDDITLSCPGLSVDSTGSGNFKITVPNWARSGVQELKVDSSLGDSGSQNVTIGGPQIMITPETVLANQRVSLVGTGFSSNEHITRVAPGAEQTAKISIGGEVLSWSRINDGDPVEIDSGGNWSASVDLPLSSATTAEGERPVRVTDSGGRTGVVVVDIPSREVTITPDTGRVGTIAVVRGNGFPSKNDEGSSFNVQVVYDAGNDKETTVSAVPDASGRFEVQLRIPTTASIPSSNTVKVTFEDDGGVAVVTTVPHEVPEGVITLSATSGGPGSTVMISGEGFKAFVPVSQVKIGALDVTPAPKPSTDGNGMMSFSVVIPGLDTGIQTIEVSVGRTTSSTGFTVTESGINPGDIKEVAVGLEALGDNFVSIWHFNNDTKMWSFYTPALAEGNSLTHLITGETYLIRVKSTTEVILNNDTRSLTCVGDNCWNQLVW